METSLRKQIYEFNRRESKKAYNAVYKQNNKEKYLQHDLKRLEREKEQRASRPPSTRIYVRTCQVTGKLFISKSPTAKYHPEHLHEITCSLKRSKWVKYQKVRHKRPCKNCGHIFQPTPGTKKRHYCSEACEKRSAKAKQKKRYRSVQGPPITDAVRYMIYLRHNYRCADCDTDCSGVIPGLHLENEPTIDHIIPVSKGGTNDISNLQLLCRKCNCTIKRDRAGVVNSPGIYNLQTARLRNFSARNV